MVMLSLAFATSTLLLSASPRLPEVLLDSPAVGAALTGQHPVLAVAGLLGLLASGVLVPVVSRGHGRLAYRLGLAGGLCLAVSAVSTLALLLLWGNDFLAAVAFWCGTAALVALAGWTVAIGRRRVTSVLAALCLLATPVRSVLWVVNTARPVVDGFHVAAAVLTVLALLGFPVWLCWLALSAMDVRRKLVAWVAAVVVVLGYAAGGTVTTPTPETDDVPAVASPGGSAFYLLMLALSGQFSPPADEAGLREQRAAERYTRPAPPAGATRELLDANGVAAERICVPGATRDRAVLYLHGGGFVLPMSNGHRRFAATLSRVTGACVLLPHYRTAPEHPFPAPVEDAVHAYRWLRQQGTDRVVVLGDSCGGTFTLAATLMLRDAGAELPDALVALSGGFDITVSGETHRTKAGSEALLGADDVRFSADSYTDGGRIDPRDPLVSPLFADVRGLPPTLLVAGTQEVLASDSVRMADHLRDAGVPVRLEMWPGMPHDFPLIAEEIMEADLALRHITSFVDRHVS